MRSLHSIRAGKAGYSRDPTELLESRAAPDNFVACSNSQGFLRCFELQGAAHFVRIQGAGTSVAQGVLVHLTPE
jgi:hypothetical protein